MNFSRASSASAPRFTPLMMSIPRSGQFQLPPAPAISIKVATLKRELQCATQQEFLFGLYVAHHHIPGRGDDDTLIIAEPALPVTGVNWRAIKAAMPLEP